MKRRDFVKTLSAATTTLLLPSGPALALQAAHVEADSAVKRVLVMFKCHFDAGFIDTQANVVHKYFSEYFPQAIETARAENAHGRRYVWTTGSWLLFEYLEQASASERAAMEAGIRRGDIAWHALPFTWQTELLSPSMIEGSLALSQSLDRRFGMVTTGAKMTDVPGHTRGLIAPLAKHGVSFLDIGVNDASTPAELPPLFLWKDSEGASLAVMYHHGYGSIARIPGSDLAIAVVVRDDNSGPHTPKEIAAVHSDLAARYPSAQISAANLSEIANSVAPLHGNLPVVSKEIGDTWIFGCPSDPLKLARFRELSRLRENWLAEGALHAGDATDLALLRHALLEAEHTWGTDTKTWLDYDNQKPADLARMLDTKNYKVVQFSWAEKRKDLFDGIDTLPAPLREKANRAMEELKPGLPVAASSKARHITVEPVESAHFVLGIDPTTGAISRLRSKATGREWAAPDHPIAQFTYQTLSKKDYDRFWTAYLKSNADWAFKDFGKPNCDQNGAETQEWHPTPTAITFEETTDGHRLVVALEFQDKAASESGRAAFPAKAFLEVALPKADPVIHIHLSCFQKPATRLPEALWLTFHPVVEDPAGWSLHKSGQRISPDDVVFAGNRQMHALSTGFDHRHNGHEFSVETIDAPVVALGTRNPIGFSTAQPDLEKGIHSCLFNNAWGTNYIMWYGGDMRFRYTIRA